MAIRDVLVVLDSEQKKDVAAAFALSLAKLHNAHLTAVAIVLEPFVSPMFSVGEANDMLNSTLLQARTAAGKHVAGISASAKDMGIVVETSILQAEANAISAKIGRLARHFDLVIAPQPEPGMHDAGTLIIESALFDSGRPVLVVPYIQTAEPKFERILVAWDGSATAARAVGDAMPLLEKAKKIEIVRVSDGTSTSQDESLRHMQIHLSRHDIQTGISSIAKAGDVANALLSFAADESSDMIVMGGFAHSRLRDLILGGATKGILGSMTVPVFLSH